MKKKKQKKNKQDIVFTILEIVGSLGIGVACLIIIAKLDAKSIGVSQFIFQVCLAFIVIKEFTFKGLGKQIKEIVGAVK